MLTTTLTNIVLAALVAACGRANPTTNPPGDKSMWDYAGAAKAFAEQRAELDRQKRAYEATLPEGPDGDGHEEDLVKPFDQHFCCEDIADKGMSGEDCKAIGPESINSCTNVLYCAGNWKKKDGVVTCE